jgi:hypothetical protein
MVGEPVETNGNTVLIGSHSTMWQKTPNVGFPLQTPNFEWGIHVAENPKCRFSLTNTQL